MVLDDSGRPIANYVYNAGGTERKESFTYNGMFAKMGEDINQIRYRGQYKDNETKNYYIANTYYNPISSRPIQETPGSRTQDVRYNTNLYNNLYDSQKSPTGGSGSGGYSAPSIRPNDPMNKQTTSLTDGYSVSVALRNTVEAYGGTVGWNSSTHKTQVNYDGRKTDYYVGDKKGTYIAGNEIMYVDSLNLDNFIFAVSGMAKPAYDTIKDDFGKFILRTWLNGDGTEKDVGGQRWTDYILQNKYVQERIGWLTEAAINDGTFSIYNVSETNLSGANGGYFSGYDLLNGANSDYGGFVLTGSVKKNYNGTYKVSIGFVFNDLVDANDVYRMDTYLANGARKAGYNSNDYVLRIRGSGIFTYSSGGLIYG